MPLSVISLSTFLLYQIPFSRTMLYQIPFSCYTWFRYTWFRYTRFHFLVIPDSRIKFPCYTWFRYTRFCYTTFHILVMPDSVIPGSVIPISYFPSYNWFRYTPFRYAQVRYTRFPIPSQYSLNVPKNVHLLSSSFSSNSLLPPLIGGERSATRW